MRVEPATLADLDAIDEIERHSFPQPWPRATFEAELARPHARVVVARDGGVAGFCNYWLVAQELHVLAIADRTDELTELAVALLTAQAPSAALQP